MAMTPEERQAAYRKRRRVIEADALLARTGTGE
jgi:hypothetical protein